MVSKEQIWTIVDVMKELEEHITNNKDEIGVYQSTFLIIFYLLFLMGEINQEDLDVEQWNDPEFKLAMGFVEDIYDRMISENN